jgi:hypothetical protein
MVDRRSLTTKKEDQLEHDYRGGTPHTQQLTDRLGQLSMAL